MATKGSTLIGIAGGTGSGKTTVAQRVLEALGPGRSALIQHDWYYADSAHLPWDERIAVNFDHPDALDNDLLFEHLTALKSGRAIECPQYDFATHTRKDAVVRVEPAPIVVVEGILLFAIANIRALFELRLFVDTDDDIRLMRRIKRDILERARDIQAIQTQYYSTVRPMHQAYVAPSKHHAHLVIPEGGENRVGIDVIVGRLLYGLLEDGTTVFPESTE